MEIKISKEINYLSRRRSRNTKVFQEVPNKLKPQKKKKTA